MRLPTFLVIGAARSGSTTLYHYLKQHPQIFMSQVKSPMYFSFDPDRPGLREWGEPDIDEEFKITTPQQYQSLFEGATDEIQVGEASVGYLESAYAPHRIKKELGDVKILAILRNPVERAYSAYRMHMRMGTSTREISDALSDPAKVHWIQVGFYHRLLKRYFDIFPRDNIKIIIFERFVRDKAGTMRDIYRFLGVNEDFTPDTSMVYAKGGTSRTGRMSSNLKGLSLVLESMLARLSMDKTVRNLRRRMSGLNVKKEPPLSRELHERLEAIYSRDIAALENLLQENIPEWH
jgi:hypothetical protein